MNGIGYTYSFDTIKYLLVFYFYFVFILFLIFFFRSFLSAKVQVSNISIFFFLASIFRSFISKSISRVFRMPGGIEIHTKGTLSKATPRKGASAKKASGQGYCKCFTRDNSEIDDDFKKEEGLPEVERSPSKKLYFFFWLPLIVHWLRLQDLRN